MTRRFKSGYRKYSKHSRQPLKQITKSKDNEFLSKQFSKKYWSAGSIRLEVEDNMTFNNSHFN